LEDVEAEESCVAKNAIHDTKPVALTRVPEYVNFWQGKLLSQREFAIPSHTRRAWQRPKSDYGSRFTGHKNEGKALATLVEGPDDSSQTPSNDSGAYRSASNSHQPGKTPCATLDSFGCTIYQPSSLSVGVLTCDNLTSRGDAVSNTDGKERQEGVNGNGGRTGMSRGASMWAQRSQKIGRRRTNSTCNSEDDNEDLSHKPNKLQSFCLEVEGCNCSKNTRFELPMDIQLLERMSPLQYLRAHCVIRF
jgi:hypothetical protein